MLAAKNPALFVNRLLATLPGKDHRQVLANCEPIELHLAEVISEPGERVVVMTKKPPPWRGPHPRQGLAWWQGHCKSVPRARHSVW